MLAVLALATPAEAKSTGLNAYRVKATAKNLEKLAMAGFDVTEGRRIGGKIEVYGTSKQIARLSRKSKVRAKLVRDRKGRTSAQRSRARSAVDSRSSEPRSLQDPATRPRCERRGVQGLPQVRRGAE